jgi:hypothetical protein
MKALSAKIAQECTPVRFNTGHPTEPFQKLLLSDFDFIYHTPGPELKFVASTYDDEDNDMGGNGDGDNEDDDDNDVEYLGERLRPDPEIDISQPRPPDNTDLSLYKDSQRAYFRSRHYNGYQSCSAHFFCPFQPMPGSMMCFLHHRMVADNTPDLSRPYGPYVRWISDLQETVIVSHPQPDKIAQFRIMHQLYRTHTTWVVDTEFCNIKGFQAVAFYISVRNARTGEIVLSTPINYGGRSLDSIERELVTKSGKRTMYNAKTTFERHYNAEHTHGMSLSAVGSAPRRVGFDPATHVLVSGWAAMDNDIIYRALLGHNALLDKTPRERMHAAISQSKSWSQPFNLGLMVRYSSNLACTRLGYVFRSIFPDQSTLVMHLADNDSLAMVQILHFFAHASREWV